MSSLHIAEDAGSVRPTGWKADALAALLLALGMVVLYAAQGFSTLTDAGGDNDSLLRLVQVRDLIAGQGWFDLHQYRMGPDGGFVMHWSRLVDAPIAGIILLVTASGGSMALGETVAAIVWPTVLFGLTLFLLMRCVRSTAGADALLPAAIIGATALYAIGIFAPGTFDHHNLQLVFLLAMLTFLVQPKASYFAGAGAGGCAALMLAVGMETAPYVAVGGVGVALSFLMADRLEARRAARFGFAFAATALAVMVTTVAPADWFAVHCDAFSAAQFTVAVVAGLGLGSAALAPGARGTLPRRAGALAVVGAVTGAVALLLFPQCLSDPYAGLDPRLQRYWLSAVSEAQSIVSVLRNTPEMAASYYGTPLLGLIVLGMATVRTGFGRAQAIVGALLLAAVLVSLWQIRGAMFSIPLAVISLAAWVGRRRAAAAAEPAMGTTLRMAAAWLLSVTVVWTALADFAADRLGRGEEFGEASTETAAHDCYTAEDYAALAALPTGTVLAPSNLGAPILRHTTHRTFAGPYHRNVAGMLVALDAFMGPASLAAQELRSRGVDYVAICPGNDEPGVLAEWAPQGLMADLMAGDTPAWLVPVDDPAETSPLDIYRVRSSDGL